MTVEMDICRICLEFKKKLYSLFEEDHGISYADMLRSIAKVKIVEGAYNNTICVQCRRKLRNLFNFKMEIERSDLELNQCFKIFKFNDIDEVKTQLLELIKGNKKDISTNSNVDNISLLANGCKSLYYKNTTIVKVDSHKNFIDMKNEVPSFDLEIANYDIANDYVDLYDNLLTCEVTPLSKKKLRQKQWKEKSKKSKKTIRRSSNLKKVCIKPIVLDNIRIIPFRRKSSKIHKEHKQRKRLDMCPHCGIMSSNMKSHMMVHIGERKFKCPECNKAFFTSNLLRSHQSKHLTAGAFKCDHCVAVFDSKTSLRSHMILHTDDKNHICSICNKGFKRKSSLLRHKLIHNSSAKSVKCELCNMSFLHKQGLRHHMRVHTGERPFRCEICSQPYSYKHDFNRHCLKKHGVFLKQRTVHVMNEEVLMKERALMRDLMLRVQGVVSDGEPLNPFKGPYAALAFGEAVKALGSCQIPFDVML